MYLDEGGLPSEPYGARFMLIDTYVHHGVYGPPTLAPIKPRWANECTIGFTLVEGEIAYVYCDLSHVYAFTPKIMAVVGAGVSGNFRAGLSLYNHRDFYLSNLELKLRPSPGIEEKIFKLVGEMPRSRITLDHHMYVSKHELAAALATDSEDRAERLRAIEELARRARHLDLYNQVSFITFATYIMAAPIFGVRLLMQIQAVSGCGKQFNWLLKAEGGAAKQLQTIFRDDLACVFELNVLRNRVYDEVDWETEIDHRVRPATAPMDPRMVREKAIRIFRLARQEGRKAQRMEWQDYWDARVSTMPNGSVVSQYQEDLRLKKQLPREGKVKSGWFAASRNRAHSFWLDRKPCIYASTSTKYEWGKVRALYGCDITSFLHADFAMRCVENTLPSYFPVGERANDRYVKQVLEHMDYGVPFCYDYDDFNSQHSIASMQAVIDAWAIVYGDQLTSAQLASLAWTKASVSDQTVKFGDVQRVEKVNGTLLSGWRLTSFVNTVLNRVYLEQAGLLQNVEYAVHNGDDMYASCETIQNALNVVTSGKKLGIRAQVSKTNIGTIGEFLRVDARAANPTGAQYLTRAIATAVHGRVEIGRANDFRSALQAVEVRADAMRKRGALRGVVHTVQQAQERFLCGLFAVSDEILTAVKTLNPIQGGLDEEGEIEDYCLKARPLPEADRSVAELRGGFSPVRPGIVDYVTKVCRVLGIWPTERMFEEAMNSYADGLLRWMVTYETVIERNPDYLRCLLGSKGKFHDDPALIDMSKSRQVGAGIGPCLARKETPLTRFLQKALNPFLALRVCT